MSRNKLEDLIGKLRSMYLAIPSTIGHFYHSALRRQQSGEVTFPTLVPPTSTSNGPPSAPTSRSTTGFKNLPLHQSKCFKCTDTRFVTDITPNNPVSGRTWLQRRGGLLPRPTYWKASPTPENVQAPLPRTWTSACHV